MLGLLGGKALNPVVTTERLIIRQPKRKDFESWRKVRAESRDFLTPWEPTWPETELTRASFTRRLRRYNQHAHNHTGLAFFLVAKETQHDVIGGITFSRLQRGVAQSCVVGYWMGSRYGGHGFMAEALSATLPCVFRELNLHRIEASCMPTNDRSIRLLEKTGFKREGHAREYLKIAGKWQDHLLYAILRSDMPSP